jgi:stage III sporulation protein AA
MNHFEKVFRCFPIEVQQQISELASEIQKEINEIRVYRGKPVQLYAGGKRYTLKGVVNGSQMHGILNNLMKFSYYAYEEDIAKGFITIDGGHRVGICGKAVMECGRVTLIRDVSSLNIRYSKEILGCSDKIMPYVFDEMGRMCNLLIVSPPGCGKTTLLRDLARNISLQGIKVGICDERSEIAGMSGGVSAYTFGAAVDVMDGCPKALAMEMMIRAMSPQILITDEIGLANDAEAIRSCSGSGVKVIASMHGSSMEDLQKTGVWEIIEGHTFDSIIFLSDQPTIGSVKEVCHG